MKIDNSNPIEPNFILSHTHACLHH